MKYRVFIDDNFHYSDEDERDEAGVFDSYEAAFSHARDLVDQSLRWLRQEVTDTSDPLELYDRYQDFGDDPFIRHEPPDRHFSTAWEYAKERVKEICLEQLQD